jgi:hypothetical protein
MSSSSTDVRFTQPELLELAYSQILAAHRLPPQHNEWVADLDSGLQRINDWAFTQGYNFCTFGGSEAAGRKIYKCCECQKPGTTRNTRRLTEVEKTRPNTRIRGTGCMAKIEIRRLVTKQNQVCRNLSLFFYC